MMKRTIAMAMAFLGLIALAMPEIPKASAKALGVTKGKPFSSGLVFINGKYLPPPYRIERWGTGIRINGRPVTGQIVDWNEFVKTQTGVKVTKSVSEVPETPAAEPAPAVAETTSAPTVVAGDDDEDDSSLDDLFDDDPKPKAKKEEKAKPAPARKSTPVVKKAPPRPKTTVSYSFDGDFVPNETTKGYVARINGVRTDIDRTLRAGGFVCFGDRYSQVTGDARTAAKLMETLPELMQRAESAEQFRASVRAAGFVYLTDALCDEIFRNRIDYRQLQERRAQQKKEQELNRMLNGVGGAGL